ncbi:acetyl-CoA carboxylase carboxyltransferase subunit alpha [Peptacetobacter sp.]|uniref:acetyl-CoA carboxylase carboxyltransferase subunit alpha n=1 Tax=Peptacetobacter sp. TaxID=2991975 RepID=UPI002608E086|nr:acetyl-CoA carboxylase carboxyltransferase subunit alpha [Peptacetobacter sp.]
MENNIDRLRKDIKNLKEISKQNKLDLSDKICYLEKLLEESIIKSRNLTPYDKVSISRDINRPKTLDYINIITSSFLELQGDRYFGDDKAIVGGIGKIGKHSVTIIGNQKGNSTKENIYRNFGMAKPEGYRKALRLMKQAEKFGRPIITFIDTSGAFCGVEAEERGEGEAIAKNLKEMSMLKVPIISIVIGEGGSGGALGIGVGNEICMLENSVYSVISPEGLSSILFKDSSKSKDACEYMKMTAKDLKEFNIIDNIIEEPLGGAQNDVKYMGEKIKEYIIERLNFYNNLNKDEIVEHRYNKYRNIGRYFY